MGTAVLNPSDVTAIKDQAEQEVKVVKADAASSPLAKIVSGIDKKMPHLQAVIPAGVDVERLRYVAFEAVRKNPDLMKCDPASVISAIVQSVELGLELNNAKKEAYLIPYGSECKFEPSYIGLATLAIRSGLVNSLYGEVAHESDTFRVSQGTHRAIQHEPKYGNRGELIAAYAVAFLPNGGYDFEVLDRSEVDAVMNVSKAKKSGPWVDWFGEMAKKSAIRRLCKRLPKDSRMEKALAISDENVVLDAESQPSAETSKTVEALKAKLLAAKDGQAA